MNLLNVILVYEHTKNSGKWKQSKCLKRRRKTQLFSVRKNSCMKNDSINWKNLFFTEFKNAFDHLSYISHTIDPKNAIFIPYLICVLLLKTLGSFNSGAKQAQEVRWPRQKSILGPRNTSLSFAWSWLCDMIPLESRSCVAKNTRHIDNI